MSAICNRTFSGTVITTDCITNAASLPGASLGVYYSQTLAVPSLIAPLAFVLIIGNLPSGLALNEVTGAIYGTPTTEQFATFTIEVTDTNGLHCVKAFTLLVGPAPLSCGWWSDMDWYEEWFPGLPVGSFSWTPSDLTGVTAFTTQSFQPLDPDGPVWDSNDLYTYLEKLGTNPDMVLKVSVNVTAFTGGVIGLGPYVYMDYDTPPVVVLSEYITSLGTHDFSFFIPKTTVARDYYFEAFMGLMPSDVSESNVAFSYTLTSYETSVVDTAGWYLVTGIDPKFYFATSTVDNPSTSITIASSRQTTWVVDSHFVKTSWAVAPTVTLDGVPVGITDGGTFWSLNLASIETTDCVVKTLAFSGPTISTPFGLTTNYIHLIPQ